MNKTLIIYDKNYLENQDYSILFLANNYHD